MRIRITLRILFPTYFTTFLFYFIDPSYNL